MMPVRQPAPSWSLPHGDVVPAAFFARPSDVVARGLVGKILWRRGVGGGRLTEVEAYLPFDDPACHAFRGRTRRNQAMFGPPGTIYVYVSYGIHVLLNLVCDSEGVGSAVLIRSFEPLGDTSVLESNRLRAGAPKSAGPGCWLSCGPGRIGQALGLSMDLDGRTLGDESGIYVLDDGHAPRLVMDARVGIREGDRLPLRFYAADSAYVTRRRRTSGGAEDEIA